MSFEILAEAQKRGITVRKFCGIDLENNVCCPREAVGEINIETDEGYVVPMPVCEPHLELISQQYKLG